MSITQEVSNAHYPSISIPFSIEKHPILQKLGAFLQFSAQNTLNFLIWAPPSLMKTHRSLYQISRKSTPKGRHSQCENPQGLFMLGAWSPRGGGQSHSGGDAYVRLKRPPFSASLSPIDPIFFTVAWALTQRPIFFHLICHSMPHDLKSWHLKKILCISP